VPDCFAIALLLLRRLLPMKDQKCSVYLAWRETGQASSFLSRSRTFLARNDVMGALALAQFAGWLVLFGAAKRLAFYNLYFAFCNSRRGKKRTCGHSHCLDPQVPKRLEVVK